MNKDDKRNAEGYLDPTAYQAIKNVEKEDQANEDICFHKLLDTIFTICELSGFHIESRIAIRDQRTGKIWR